MKLKFLLAALACYVGYYFWSHPQDITHPTRIITYSTELAQDLADDLYPFAETTQPAGILVTAAPSIYRVNAAPWRLNQYSFQPLFGYHLHARVLSKTHYTLGRETDLSSYDLALGWQSMSDTNILKYVTVTQSDRWYYYHYPDASPIEPSLIPLESGNMHTIAGTPEIMHTLHRIKKGNVIELGGYLVEINAPDGWHWRSGTSTTGEGQGSCKVIWITYLAIER